MADQRLTDKTNITSIDDSDLLHVVDVSDTSGNPEGTSKKGLWSLIKSTLKTYFDSLYILEGYSETGTKINNDLVIDIGNYDDIVFFRYNNIDNDIIFGDVLSQDTGANIQFQEDGINLRTNTLIDSSFSRDNIRFNNANRSIYIRYKNLTSNRDVFFPNSSGTIPLSFTDGNTTVNANDSGLVDISSISVGDGNSSTLELNINTIKPNGLGTILSAASGTQIREIGNIIKVGGNYYATVSIGTLPYSETNVDIKLLSSTDLISWVDEGVILNNSEDPYMVYNEDNSNYYLYVEDKVPVPFTGIKLYTSTDLSSWTDQGYVLDKNPVSNNWDSGDVSSPVVFIDNGTWYMYYEGRDGDNNYWGAIGLATSSDGISWTKYGNSPLYSGADYASSPWSSSSKYTWGTETVPDDIVKIGSKYYLFHHAYRTSDNLWSTGVLVTNDFINLENWSVNSIDSGIYPNLETTMVYNDERIGGYGLISMITDDSQTENNLVLNGFGVLNKNQNSFVDLTTNQTINGVKTFNDVLNINVGGLFQKIIGNGTDVTNNIFMGFYEANGTTRQAYFGFADAVTNDILLSNETTTGHIAVYVNGGSDVGWRVLADGNMGIGKNTASEKLDVNGRVIANGYKSLVVTSTAVTGTYNIDYEDADTYDLTLTGTTALTESNVPTTGTTQTVVIFATGGDITLPTGGTNFTTGTYDGTKDNWIVIKYFNTKRIITITQAD